MNAGKRFVTEYCRLELFSRVRAVVAAARGGSAAVVLAPGLSSTTATPLIAPATSPRVLTLSSVYQSKFAVVRRKVDHDLQERHTHARHGYAPPNISL